MNVKCKCGALIEISPQVTSAPEPRVTCPQCRRQYRLRPRGTSVQTGTSVQRPGTSPAGPTAASPTAVTTPVARPAATPAPTAASPPPPTVSRASVFSPGDVLAGRYRIVHFLAQGGMGEVYEAEDMELRDEKVALKTISGGAANQAAIDRFKREVSLARKVTHPNVCRIFDLGQHKMPGGAAPSGESGGEGTIVTFLTMELLVGETLAKCLRRGRLTTAKTLAIAQQIAAALDAAHQASVIHRDLKSENIFLVRDAGMMRAVVTDFGIARGGRDDQFAAMVTGMDIVGTPAYMSPEQVEGKPVTAAADIYAFGVVLYEMVTGRLPFIADNPLTTAVKRLSEAPPPPRLHVPDLDPRWEEVILRCLERYPDGRFLSAGEAVKTLEAVTHPTLQGSPTLGAPAEGLPSQALPTQGPPTQGPPTHAPPTHAPPSTYATAQPPSTGHVPAGTPTPTAHPLPQGGMVTTASLYRSAAVKPEPRSLRPLLVALVVVAALSAGLFAFNFLRQDKAQRVPRRSIAVVGFENLSGQEDKEWLATALAEMLGTELAHGEKLRTIPGDQVARMKQEIGIETPKDLPAERLRQIHAVLGCDFVVSGSFVAASPQLRIDLRLADAAVGKLLTSLSEQGDEADLFELVKGLGSELRERLGAGSSRGGQDPLAGLPKDRQAARLYSEALDSLRRYDPRAARDTLGEAVRIEPDNPLIRSALSSAWAALGFDERAAEEARRAFELSSDLPQEDRLLVEGHFRETEGDWAAAMEIYRRLWNFFPDNLEYGLRLAAAEIQAGRPAEALASITRLRELPPPSSEDVRIDLAEAKAASMTADFARQLEAAQRGSRQAAAIGAVLLEAQALVAESQALRALGQARQSAEAARKSRELYEKVGQTSGTAIALLNLSSAQFDLGQLDEAIATSELAAGIYSERGEEGGRASALGNLALMLKTKGELERAQSLYEEVEKTFEKTGNRRGLANAVNNQAAVLILRDELGEAREMFERAREIWAEAGDPASQAISLNNVAAVLRLEGKLAASRRANEEALAIRRRIGQRGGEVFSLINLGGVLADLGELGEAETFLTQARDLALEMGHRSALGYCLFELGNLRLVQGRLDEAKSLHDEAVTVRQELGEKLRVAESHAALARLKLERAEPAAAEIDARHATDAFSKDGRRAEEGQANALLAIALLEQDLLEEARRSIVDARELAADSQQFAVRFRIHLAEARLAAARRETGTALRSLVVLDQEAAEAGFVGLAYEARLTRLLIEGNRASESLRELSEEAAAKGFGWIASRARGARGSQGSQGSQG